MKSNRERHGIRPVAQQRRYHLRQAGFTLIEMLVVVVIILILLGVVFQMTRPALDRANVAATAARLERLKAAIEEFYAEYGQYPPVPYYDSQQPVAYEYPDKRGMRDGAVGGLRNATWDTSPLFTFGLMSYLKLRVPKKEDRNYKPSDLPWHATLAESAQWSKHNTTLYNQERDEIAVARWEHFLDGAGLHSDIRSRGSYTNSYLTAWDAWERDFIYISPPPHQSYLLFSKGRDGKYDTSDPANRKSKYNRDNIYGDAGF